jgi:hypothetical protein
MKVIKTEYRVSLIGFEPLFRELDHKGYIEMASISKNYEGELLLLHRHGYFPNHPFGKKAVKYFNKNKELLDSELKIDPIYLKKE